LTVALAVVAAEEVVQVGENFAFCRLDIESGVGAKDLAHLGKKFIFEKALDLIAPDVHDAVDAEVQLGVVELEEFGEQGLEFFKVLGHRLLISYASPSLG
jgi:hypothetical protein